VQKVKFTENVVLYDENGVPRYGYQAGEIAELENDVAHRWLRRGKAEPYDGTAEASEVLPVREPATLEEVIAAIPLIDAEDRALWTAQGLPKVDALETVLENRTVSGEIRDLAFVKFTERRAGK
jgi:hypothetical protein